MFRIIFVLVGYALGMIQTSYIMGRLSGIDIRDHGSKSAGFTNTNRVLGIKKGAVVFVIDVLKAMAAFWLVTLMYNAWFAEAGYTAGGTFFPSGYLVPGLYGGIGAVLGHVFPFFLKFKGGKGVACLLGIIVMLDWRVMAIAFALGLAAVIITRFISVASLIISLTTGVLIAVFAYSLEAIVLVWVLAVLVWVLHRANIKRLLAREENRFSFRRSGQKPSGG